MENGNDVKAGLVDDAAEEGELFYRVMVACDDEDLRRPRLELFQEGAEQGRRLL